MFKTFDHVMFEGAERLVLRMQDEKTVVIRIGSFSCPVAVDKCTAVTA